MTGPLQQHTMPGSPPAASPPANGHRPAKGQRGTALPTRTRPKGYAALAVALIVGFGALGFWFYTSAGSKTPVVMATQEIPIGHVIQREDLTTVEVAGGVTAVAGANLRTLVGRVAAVEILPNTLVQRAMVTGGSPVPAGQGLVGVAAAPGQIPSSGLVPGDKVEVLQLPQKDAPVSANSSAASSVLVGSATVFDVRPNTTSTGGTLLTLVVPKDAAYGVAQASNDGQIALVKLGG